MERQRGVWTECVAAQFRAERAAANLTQQQVIDQGPAKSTLIRLEQGTRIPDIEQIATLCDVYDVPVEVFMARVAERVRARR